MVSEGKIKITDKTAKPRMIRGKKLRLVTGFLLVKGTPHEKAHEGIRNAGNSAYELS
jgi:hypothetical protein